MNAVSAAGWRSALSNALPGAEQQAERDAAAFFDVEFPAFREFVFDAERASRLSQPVLYLLGGESGPLFEAAQRHFEALVPNAEFARVPGVDHLMQMGDPKRVAAPIADFLARHPL
jgi:pimeloyl-ACP methyl ester carboxylesterase